MPRIVITRSVRVLLGELHSLMTSYDTLTERLAYPRLGYSACLDLGAEREHLKVRILGLANRLHHASLRQSKIENHKS